MERLDKIEALLVQCESDLKTLKDFQKSLKRIEANRKELEEYYQHQYMADLEIAPQLSKHYNCLNEDSIWEVTVGIYDEKINPLKSITKTL